MLTSRSRSLAAAPFAAVIAIALGMLAPAGAGAAFPGPDGPIVFDSNRDVAAGEIYSIVPGGEALRLTNSTTSTDPAISPDGSKIVYRSADPGGSYQIFVMNADGTGRTPVTSTPTAKQDPTWSPDGTKIAYVANSFDVDGGTDLEIWTINANGTGRTQVTHNINPDTQPAWSPLGDKIAFKAARPGDTNTNIYVMDADGGNEVSLTPNGSVGCSPNCYGGNDEYPAWSPDGSKIAYVHGQTITGGGLPSIWTMSPDGGGRANLSGSGPVSFTQPAWSPQGTRIAVVGAETTDRNIWVMNSNGSGQAPIDTATSFEQNPDWGQPGPAPEPPPNDISFGKAKLNKKKGTAKLPVNVLAAGALELAGKGVKSQSKSAAGAGTVKLKIKAAGKARKRLEKKGKVKVKPAVTFTPVGGVPNTETKRVKLIKK